VPLVSSGVVLQPGLDVFNLSAAVIVNGGATLAHGEEFKSGVSSDFETFNFVGSGVELGNNKVRDILEVSGNLVPNGGKLFAVAAPGGIEFDKNILLFIKNNIIEGFTNNNGDWFVLLRSLLTLEEWLEFSTCEIINETLQFFDLKILD